MSTYIKVDTGSVPHLGRRWRGEASGAVQRILANGSVIVQRSMRKNAPVGVTQRLAGNIQRTVGNGEAVYHRGRTKTFNGGYAPSLATCRLSLSPARLLARVRSRSRLLRRRTKRPSHRYKSTQHGL